MAVADMALALGPLASPAATVKRPPPGAPRRRWTLRARDLRHRTTYVVTAVHAPSMTVTLYLTGPAVLGPADLRRLRCQLDDALACVIADGADWA